MTTSDLLHNPLPIVRRVRATCGLVPIECAHDGPLDVALCEGAMEATWVSLRHRLSIMDVVPDVSGHAPMPE